MSSPAAPTSVAMAPQNSRSTNRPPTSNGVGPSTPAATATISTPRSNATPSTIGNNASFLSPNAGRFGGKYIGKSPATGATGTPTPAPGGGESPALVGLEGATGMGFSMSSLGMGMGLGLSSSAMGSSSGKLDDAERRRRLEGVLESLESRSGIISQEAVSRLGRKWGLELYEEIEDTKLLTLGGNSFALDVSNHPPSNTRRTVSDHTQIYFESTTSPDISRVALHFHGLNDTVVAHAPLAAAILHADLQSPKDLSRINADLAGFADNLERLARLDKLSITGASCFEAITGVYTSLRRLFEFEVAGVAAESGQGGVAEREVLCRRSGVPRMHARKRVGLVLDYWMHGHLLPPATRGSSSADTPEDTPPPAEHSNDSPAAPHSLTIECEYHPAALYPCIRISTDWLSIPTQPESTANDTSNLLDLPSPPGIHWLDPPPPHLTVDRTLSTPQPQPPTRFTARLEPAVTLPLSVATDLHSTLGLTIPTPPASTSVWDTLLTRPHHNHDEATAAASTADPLTPRTSHIRNVPAVRDADPTRWHSRLYVARPELGVVVERIPFAHPRELSQILPRLRQHVLLARLVGSAFSDGGAHAGAGVGEERGALRHRSARAIDGTRTTYTGTPLRDGDADPGKGIQIPSTDSGIRTLDVTLTQGVPNPRLIVKMPRVRAQSVSVDGRRTFRVDVLDDGVLKVGRVGGGGSMHGENGSGEMNGDGEDAEMERLARGLEVCEDLCVWAGWVIGLESESGGDM